MKNLIILVLILFTHSLHAKDYIDYYKKVNQAEISIVNKDYDEALKLYNEAFSIVDSPFLNDLYNATICASYTNNTDDGLKFIREFLKTGNSIKTFKRRAFKNIRKDKRWKILKLESDDIVNKANLLKNNELQAKIDRMYIDDQHFRKKRGSYAVYRDTINKLDSINAIKLIEIFKQYGYPNRNTVKEKPFGTIDFYIVVRHYYQKKGYLLSDILLKEVTEGRLQPRVFAELEDKKSFWQNKCGKYGTTIFYKNKGKIHEFRISDEDIARFNKNRNIIGLSSFEDYKKKVLFNQTNTPFFFNIYEGLVYVHF